MVSSLPQIRGAVLVIGDVMEDIIVKPEGPMVRGSDVRASIRSCPGGAGANQAMWLAASGVPARFVGRVAAEDLERVSHNFARQGVEPVLIGDPDLPTGRLVSLVEGGGERSFFTDRGANLALTPADLPDTIFDGIGLVHLSGYTFFETGTRAVALELIRRAKTADIPFSIDPASVGFLKDVGAATFLNWIDGAAVFFPNAEEAGFLTGTVDLEAQCRALGERFGVVMIKRGADGAVAGGKSGISASAPAVALEVVDTTGAGDAFFAGFIAALTAGGDLQQCLEGGNAAGALAAGQFGAQPG